MRGPARRLQSRALPETTLNASKSLPLVLAATAALGLGVWAALRWHAPAPMQLQSGIVLSQPRPIQPFTLADHDGRPFGNERLRGSWSLLFAGFTHCPDVCPTTLALMKVLDARLRQQDAALNLVFLSVDPERDTGEKLRTYVRHFSPAITGVTGSRDQLDALCASLGIAYVRNPGAREGDYTVDHSAALVLIDPSGRVAGYFQPPHKLDTLAADLAGIIAA